MKYGIYIKAPDEYEELQVIVDNMGEVKQAIEMLETYYDMYSHYSLYYKEIQKPEYKSLLDLKQKYRTLGQ